MSVIKSFRAADNLEISAAVENIEDDVGCSTCVWLGYKDGAVEANEDVADDVLLMLLLLVVLVLVEFVGWIEVLTIVVC